MIVEQNCNWRVILNEINDGGKTSEISIRPPCLLGFPIRVKGVVIFEFDFELGQFFMDMCGFV